VLAALETTGAPAFFYYPKNFKSLPCLSYYEASNAPAISADDREFISELIFVVDVWAKTSSEASELAAKADGALTDAGLRRDFAQDVHDPASDVRHITARYKILKG
jgi:uncharacterized protein YjiS (DUF1127 family)